MVLEIMIIIEITYKVNRNKVEKMSFRNIYN